MPQLDTGIIRADFLLFQFLTKYSTEVHAALIKNYTHHIQTALIQLIPEI